MFDEPLIVSGMRSSGKSALIPLLKCFSDFYFDLKSFHFGQYCQLESTGILDRDVATALFRYHADFRYYDLKIGRGINIRLDDETSLWNFNEPSEMFKRINMPRGELALCEGKPGFDLKIIDIHNGLSHIDFLLHVFSGMRLINLSRSGVSTVFSWVRDRIWAQDSLKKPLSQVLVFEHHGALVPIVAREWADEFLCLSLADRSVEMYRRQLSADLKGKSFLEQHGIDYLDIGFEDLLVNPRAIVLQIEQFLRHPHNAYLNRVLKKEGLPRDFSQEDLIKKFEILKPQLSTKNSNFLHDMI